MRCYPWCLEQFFIIISLLDIAVSAVLYILFGDLLTYHGLLLPVAVLGACGVLGFVASYLVHIQRFNEAKQCRCLLVLIGLCFICCGVCCLVFLAIMVAKDIRVGKMDAYKTHKHHKIMIDKTQMLLNCCGNKSYKDWFNLDWQGLVVTWGQTPPSEVLSRYAVPFSCCSPGARSPCAHNYLVLGGEARLYRGGCKVAITTFTTIFMFLVTSSLVVTGALMLQWGYCCREDYEESQCDEERCLLGETCDSTSDSDVSKVTSSPSVTISNASTLTEGSAFKPSNEALKQANATTDEDMAPTTEAETTEGDDLATSEDEGASSEDQNGKTEADFEDVTSGDETKGGTGDDEDQTSDEGADEPGDYTTDGEAEDDGNATSNTSGAATSTPRTSMTSDVDATESNYNQAVNDALSTTAQPPSELDEQENSSILISVDKPIKSPSPDNSKVLKKKYSGTDSLSFLASPQESTAFNVTSPPKQTATDLKRSQDTTKLDIPLSPDGSSSSPTGKTASPKGKPASPATISEESVPQLSLSPQSEMSVAAVNGSVTEETEGNTSPKKGKGKGLQWKWEDVDIDTFLANKNANK